MSTEKISPGGGDTGAPYNLRKRIQLIDRYTSLRGKKILDCGCGHGQYLLALLGAGGDVYGIEYDAAKVAAFQKEYQQHAARVQAGDLEHVSYDSHAFDAALLNEVLEHVSDEAAALREIHRILKPGGILVVFSPNRFYPFETHGVYWKGTDTKIPHYVPFIPYIPLSVGRIFFNYWARNYWPSQLRRQITEIGFEITNTGYVWQTFENISGRQPAWLKAFGPALRRFGDAAEKNPFIKVFGVSQYVVARKAVHAN